MTAKIALPMRVLWRRRQLDRSRRWSRQKLERHQARCLERLRAFAYGRSSFYRSFHRGLETSPLSDLPILSKAQLMERFDEVVTDPQVRLNELESFLAEGSSPRLFRDRYVVLATSGSTGRRGVFLFNNDEWISALASITRPLAWIGLNPNPFRPRPAALIASTATWHYSARVSHSLSSRLLPALRLDATEPLPRLVERLNAWQPVLLGAYPSVLRQLAEEQVAGRLRIPLRDITTSAEVLTEETRARATQAWNARIHDTYGATEYAPIAAECAFGERHLVEDGALIEIVDERGRPVPHGVDGERVLLTVFDRFTQPLIRYEISDMVRTKSGACQCGRPFRLIDSIAGRQEDVLVFPAMQQSNASDGTVSIHPNVFHGLLERLPASAWQVVQEGETLQILLTSLRSGVSLEEISNSVRRRIESEGAIAPRVLVTTSEELRRGASGKAPLIQCARPWRKEVEA